MLLIVTEERVVVIVVVVVVRVTVLSRRGGSRSGGKNTQEFIKRGYLFRFSLLLNLTEISKSWKKLVETGRNK
jgi:hypothetical protein